MLQKYKLGELVDVVRGASLSGDYYSTEGEYIRLTCGNFDYRNNCFKENTSKDNLFYAGAFKAEFLLEKGDIITPLTEQAIGLLGTTARIPESGKYIQSQDIALIKCKVGKIDPTFCYYLIPSRLVRDQLSAAAQQTKIRHTSPDKMKACTVWVPELDDQKAIGRLLASFDEKIQLNKRINDNLEAMAKQLYDYWFVQFDFPNEEGKPYKSSGGAMVWNEKLKREIPQGWSFSNVKSLIEPIERGISYSSDDLLDPFATPMINLACFSKAGDYRLGEMKFFSGKVSNDKLISPMDMLIACTDMTQGADIIGRPILASDEYDQYTFSTDLALITPKGKFKMYLYYTLRTPFYHKYIRPFASGTTVKHLNLIGVENYGLPVPPIEIQSKFEDLITPIKEKQSKNLNEINALTKQRDELLPLLMNGQASVNYHLSALFLSSLILYRDQYKFYDMKETIIQTVLDGMRTVLTENQLEMLTDVTRKALSECEITPKATEEEQRNKENAELLGAFISSKKVEGCSDKTVNYYKSSIEKLIVTVKKNVCDISTNDIRCYLAEQQEQRGLSKVTIDNLRRIYSSFFSWLEDEDYITKSPVRRIHKVRTDALVKEVLTDENIEVLRDSCHELRDIAMIDLLLSTGMRVGELVRINREDIDLHERQCVVFGKGNKEREVYFNARAKIHLKKYLEQRTDDNPALFVSLKSPYNRLTINGVEVRLRKLGAQANIATKVHPHKFRRTLATMAIDKGMPIEQVQKMLGHVKIDTTMHYAMVNQANVKIAHRKFIN